MEQIEFDLDEGKRLRDVGMERSIQHADFNNLEWSIKAWAILERYLSENNEVFMAEDLRDYAHKKRGLPFPPDGRAWGSVIMKAVKSKLIHRVGYAPMKSKNCHANPKSVWRKSN